MASYTPNYNLKKPAGTDVVDIDDLNGNMDIIDTQLDSLNSKLTLKKQSVTIGTITLNASGYVDISSYKPNVHVVFTTIGYWSSMSPIANFGVTTGGQYIIGSANQQITGLSVDYFYYD